MPDLVKVGFNYPDPDEPGEEIRHEPGEMIAALPEEMRTWLLAHGVLESHDEHAPVPRPERRKVRR